MLLRHLRNDKTNQQAVRLHSAVNIHANKEYLLFQNRNNYMEEFDKNA